MPWPVASLVSSGIKAIQNPTIEPLRGRANTLTSTQICSLAICISKPGMTLACSGAWSGPTTGLLIIMTRWHVDDLLGRLLRQSGHQLRVLRYPALAQENEDHWMSDWQLTSEGWLPAWRHIRRSKGAALFPELKPKSFLLEQRELLPPSSWESLYQQNPIIAGGGELPIEKLRILPHLIRSKITRSALYWDKGGSVGKDAAYTAGVLMHKLDNDTFVIEHIARGRWSTFERERQIKSYSDADTGRCSNLDVWIEQEPGSAGKESAEATIRSLAGLRVHAHRVTGSKQVRAQPFAAQVQAGNVWLLAGDWVQDFFEECEAWPNGKYKDQVDAAAGAFNKLTTSSYDTTYSWV
jgi:predicted phage terminase large subunit-like protein